MDELTIRFKPTKKIQTKAMQFLMIRILNNKNMTKIHVYGIVCCLFFMGVILFSGMRILGLISSVLYLIYILFIFYYGRIVVYLAFRDKQKRELLLSPKTIVLSETFLRFEQNVSDYKAIELKWNELDSIYVSSSFIVFATGPKEIIFWIPRRKISEQNAQKVLEMIDLYYPIKPIKVKDWI